MKHLSNLLLLSLIIHLISTTLVMAQYRSLFDPGDITWDIATFGFTQSPWDNYRTDSITVGADTMIDGKQYSILSIQVFFDTINLWIDDTMFAREDTTQGKVWVRSKYWGFEDLVFDYSLNQNDTFKGFRGSVSIPVDSVYYQDDRKHIRLNYVENTDNPWAYSEKLTFIEGIGSNYGFYYYYIFPSHSEQRLLCAHRNGSLLYHHTFTDTFIHDCRIYASEIYIGIDQIQETYPVVYPNPVKKGQAFTVKTKLFSEYEISVYNTAGIQCTGWIKIQSGNEISLQTNGLVQGLYFVLLRNKYGISSAAKVLIIE